MRVLIFLVTSIIEISAIDVYAKDLVFKCSTLYGEEILLYQQGDMIKYKFGKAGLKPDIEIIMDPNELDMTQEIPEGTGLNSAIEFKNGAYSYVVNESINRISAEHESIAWLDVKRNGNVIRSIDCNIDTGSLSDISVNHK